MRIGEYLYQHSRGLIPEASLFDKVTDYVIKENTPHEYIISKWSSGKEPKEVYRINHLPASKRWVCTCPAGKKGTCKHVRMVKDWIKNGKTPAIPDEDMGKLLKKLKIHEDVDPGFVDNGIGDR